MSLLKKEKEYAKIYIEAIRAKEEFHNHVDADVHGCTMGEVGRIIITTLQEICKKNNVDFYQLLVSMCFSNIIEIDKFVDEFERAEKEIGDDE
jgi:hypothetical protein